MINIAKNSAPTKIKFNDIKINTLIKYNTELTEFLDKITNKLFIIINGNNIIKYQVIVFNVFVLNNLLCILT